ncbi:MFS transporter [Kineococcus sp. TBRC 1896]|uniref:MFS transporter n=1 Tax=Kineococcus mangrovi TaxID=1660183 RepID=A0ABV4I8V2_9ACTN
MLHHFHHHRPLLSLVMAVGVATVGTGLFIPVSLLFFTRVSDVPLTTIGALTSAGAVLSLPVPVLAGWWADRHGARAVVVAGQLVQAVGFAGYLVARDPVPVFAAIAAVAVGQRLFWSSFFTLVADLPVPREAGRTRDRRYAVIGMVQAGGLGAGALLAGLLLASSSTTVYLGLAAANTAIYVFSALLLLSVPRVRRSDTTAGRDQPTRRAVDGYRRLLTDRPYLALIAANTAFAVASVFLATALPVYVVDGLHAPGWIVGPVLAANTVVLATGQLAAARLVRGLRRTTALAVAGGLWTAWSLLSAAATGVPTDLVLVYLAGVTLLYAAAELIHAPLSNALAAEAAPEPVRGTYLAMFQYGFTVATIVVPVTFTALFSRDVRLPWLALAAATTVASFTVAALGRHLPPEAVRASSPPPS